MKKLLLTIVTFCSLFIYLNAQNDAMMQAFYWNVPVDEANLNGTWWDNLANKANELKDAGITGILDSSPIKRELGDCRYGIRHL
jgi:alpha-amylase